MLELKNVSKIYQTKEEKVFALDHINLSFKDNGLVFILGQSGSGKTTMLNVLGGIDSMTEGEVLYDGNSLSSLSLEEYRRDIISFVFQEYNLLPKLNVYENLAFEISSKEKEEEDKLVKDILSKIGLEGYENRRVNELSGGQKQRIAIGRALAKNSKILLCDEPTGNLDSNTSKDIIELLKVISKEKLVIVVSHNEELANSFADRIVHIKDGKVDNDEEIHDLTDNSNQEIKKNTMSFKTILNYGLNNLSSHKFKTVISAILLVLSFISIGCMAICLTYSSESINYKLSKEDKFEYVVINSGSQDFPTAAYYGHELNDIDSIIDSKVKCDGYDINGIIYYMIEGNEDIFHSFDFYFKEPLKDNACYITDYYLYFVLGKDTDYKINNYSDLLDLKNTEVYYKDIFQYTIAGIIKTDYLDYYNSDLSQKTIEEFPIGLRDSVTLSDRVHYEYKVLYGNKTTFNSLELGENYLCYSNSDLTTISCDMKDETKELNYISINFNESASNYKFFTNEGYFASIFEESDTIKKVTLANDEIVLGPEFYEMLFNVKIDWFDLYCEYYTAIYNSNPLVNAIPHLGETISFTIKDNHRIIEIKNVKIVGVEVQFGANNEYFYANRNIQGLENINVCKKIVSKVDWQNIGNKYNTVVSLRKDNMLLSGARFDVAYDYEPFITYMLYFFIGLAVIFALITIISIINLVIQRINDNKKEIGILYASGCRRKEIVLMYMIPIIFIALITLSIAVIVIIAVCIVTNNLLMKEGIGYIALFAINWQTILLLAFTFLFTISMGVIPLYNYLRKSPMDIIRNTY